MSDQVTSENYVALALTTECTDFPAIRKRLQSDQSIRLLHAALGLGSEVGEIQDMLKKHLIYGAPLDLVNAGEELGDIDWYAAVMIDIIKTTLNEVLTKNISKLQQRYPEKFTKAAALNRDLAAERRILEFSETDVILPPTSGTQSFRIDNSEHESRHVDLILRGFKVLLRNHFGIEVHDFLNEVGERDVILKYIVQDPEPDLENSKES